MSFNVLFDLRQNKQLSKQSWGWWFDTPSRPLLRHSNGYDACVSPGITEFTSPPIADLGLVITPNHTHTHTHIYIYIYIYIGTCYDTSNWCAYNDNSKNVMVALGSADTSRRHYIGQHLFIVTPLGQIWRQHCQYWFKEHFHASKPLFFRQL